MPEIKVYFVTIRLLKWGLASTGSPAQGKCRRWLGIQRAQREERKMG